MSYYQQVQDYFNGKADQYDDVDNQLYWVFSDLFYKEVLKRELGDWIAQRQQVRLLDAGAGTGRWTMFFCELFGKNVEVSGTLIDISKGMLDVAEGKLSGGKETFECIHGNIEKMDAVADQAFDIGLSFYNVLSFVEHPDVALKQVHSKLADGGLYLAVVGNAYHAYYFSLLTNRLEQLENVHSNRKIRFNDAMPDMHCFTPAELETLYQRAGFSDVRVVGGPNFLYPGMEETFVRGATDSLQSLLSESDTFKKLLDIELEHYTDPHIVGRSNTLLVIAKK